MQAAAIPFRVPSGNCSRTDAVLAVVYLIFRSSATGGRGEPG
jgi:predicted RNA polymerase sigma factor